jgi:hypothetical protein
MLVMYSQGSGRNHDEEAPRGIVLSIPFYLLFPLEAQERKQSGGVFSLCSKPSHGYVLGHSYSADGGTHVGR